MCVCVFGGGELDQDLAITQGSGEKVHTFNMRVIKGNLFGSCEESAEFLNNGRKLAE